MVEVVDALATAELVRVRAPEAWRVTRDADVVLEGSVRLTGPRTVAGERLG